jgi:hypothetical protein
LLGASESTVGTSDFRMIEEQAAKVRLAPLRIVEDAEGQTEHIT